MLNLYKTYVCITVCVSCTLIWFYASVIGMERRPYLPLPGHDVVALNKIECTTETTNTKFVYSTYELFNTILDIRRRNCQSANIANTTICHELEDCNTASVLRPPSYVTCQRRLPRSIIVGVYKGGTREVIDFLMMHPQIVIKRNPYEISFFSTEWGRGLDWYKNAMPFSMPDQITMEKSPNYFSHPETPDRIHRSILDVKLILLVRDPVDRIISHATRIYKSRNESMRKLSSFTNNPNKSKMITHSKYDEAFQRYLQHFNRSQIHVIESDRIRYDMYDVLRGIETYLNLPHFIKKSDFVLNKKSGFFCLRSVKKTLAVCFGKTRGRVNMSDAFEVYKPTLSRIFKPHNERFFDLLGRKFNWQ